MSNFTRTLEDNKAQFPVNCPSFLGKSGSTFQPDRSEEKINHFHELDNYSNNEFACPRTPNIPYIDHYQGNGIHLVTLT